MRKEVMFVLLPLMVWTGCCGNKKGTNKETDSDTVSANLDYRTISFYYNWYGNPETDGKMDHWAHPIIPTPGQAGDAGAISGLNNDIACDFYPELGTYSSNDREIVREHIRMHVKANVGVLSVTWWGERDYGNRSVPLLLDEAAKEGVKICFHIEPFNGRSPETVRDNIRYIIDTYGKHPAFYRPQGKPMFFIYDSYLIKPGEWAKLFSTDGELTVRNTPYDAIFIGLTLKESELSDIEDAAMDGFYTYFAATGFTNASTPSNWKSMQQWAKEHNKLFIPSVGPGYIDTRIRPWNGGTTRDREDGKYYDEMYRAAIESGAPYISITSFNEWHEGTQIEPAVPLKCDAFEYLDYQPLANDYYLVRTAHWVNEFKKVSSAFSDSQ